VSGTLSAIAFYVVEKDGLYLERNWFDKELHETRAHFARAEGAEKHLKEMQGKGFDVEGAVILPVRLSVGPELIKPKLQVKKSGFAIQLTTKGYNGKQKKAYWKSNKVKKYEPNSLYGCASWTNLVETTVSASTYKTKAEAEAKLAEIIGAHTTLIAKWDDGDGDVYDADSQQRRADELRAYKYKIVKV